MQSRPELDDGSRTVAMGRGPAGSFASHFLLQIANRAGLNLQVDVHEPRDLSATGPKGCNMCGGIVSESLVQSLAAEGINLPPAVVQRGIDSCFLHMDVGSVRIDTSLQEMRIAAVQRGTGPRGSEGSTGCQGLDGYLLELAMAKGANLMRKTVDGVAWEGGRSRIKTQDGCKDAYDLLAVATSVNTPAPRLFESPAFNFKPPQITKTYICEFYMGREIIQRYLGASMHVFLLNIPRLEFAALIPKGDYVTMCLFGKDIDEGLVQFFLNAPQVRRCLLPYWQLPGVFCHCSPRLNIGGAANPFADRVVFIGDCGVTRLFKDGIGAAYGTAKAAAITAVFEGVAAPARDEDKCLQRIEEEMDRYAYLFASPEDGDPYVWLQQLACCSPIIHLLQTDGLSSSHRSFADENNRRAIIQADRVLKAIAVAYSLSPEPGMPPECEEIYLTLEIPETADLSIDILDRLAESVSSWRRYVPRHGLNISESISGKESPRSATA